jgi:hypothetical protein
MSRYTAEQKAASIARARRLLAELDARPPYEPAELARENPRDGNEINPPTENPNDHLVRYGIPLADPNGVERWRAEVLEAEAERGRAQMQTTSELNAQRTREWEQWADRRIAAALAAHARGTEETLAKVIAHERGRVAKLEARIAALETKQRGIDNGAVIELPSPLVRKVRIDA